MHGTCIKIKKRMQEFFFTIWGSANFSRRNVIQGVNFPAKRLEHTTELIFEKVKENGKI